MTEGKGAAAMRIIEREEGGRDRKGEG